MHDDDILGCPAVLALELPAGAQPARTTLDRDEAATLAGLVADDLRALLPGVERARLALAGAHVDLTEALRPQFPLFATLQEMASRLQGDVVALGAHDGRMPAQALQPDPALAGSALRLVPWTLLAPAAVAQALGAAMETELVGRGEAGARTADFLIRALDVPLEHARYLTRHDLMALACVQYEHVGLGPLWALLEAALLAPQSREDVVSARGLPLRYADGSVQAASPLAHLRRVRHDNADAAAHTLAGWVFELRQYAAGLAAHGLPFRVGDPIGVDGVQVLQHVGDADPTLPPPRLFTHPAPGLGVVAVSVAQVDGARRHVLAHALHLGGPLSALCERLAQRYGADATPQALDRLYVDAHGVLQLPGPRLH